MKVFAVTLLLIATEVLSSPGDADVLEKFHEHCKRYSLAFEQGSDAFIEALDNFAANERLIAAHNADPAASYTMRHNAFTHMSLAEFRDYFSLDERMLHLLPEAPATAPVTAPMQLKDIPAAIDWTAEGKVTPVKMQGHCGSCWAFSTTGALEGALAIAQGSNVSAWGGLSEQHLVDCDANGTHGNNCRGGTFAFDWVAANGGLCAESEYAYTSGSDWPRVVDGSCAVGTSSCTVVEGSDAFPASTWVTPESEDALRAAVALQPVSVGVHAGTVQWHMYDGGVMAGPCSPNPDHAVLVVGYGDDPESGLPYWKVKNSWGADWGMDGYILLARNSTLPAGTCGILSFPVYPTGKSP